VPGDSAAIVTCTTTPPVNANQRVNYYTIERYNHRRTWVSGKTVIGARDLPTAFLSYFYLFIKYLLYDKT